ncbi:MAG: autotransporter domain-containing protein, partial [Pseudomonadota bacterium]
VGGGAINAATAGANMVQAATELAEQIDRLKAAGATNIIAITLPDIGTTPAAIAGGPASQALQSGLSDAFNTQLLTSLRGKDVVIVDAAKLLNGVAANPARYGFTAPNAATVPGCTVISSLTCIQGVNTLPDSEQRIYADGVHPTTAAHALFAQAGFAGLQAATQNGTMAVSILTAIRQQALSLENRLNPTALVTTSDAGDTVRRRIGHIEWYGGPEVGYYEADAEQVRPGLSAVTQVVKFGADVMVTNNALVGLAGSIDHGQVKFDGDKGHFDSRLFIGGAFGMVALPRGVYLNAAAAVGLIDIYDIERSFMLGPAEESYESDTDGLYTMIRGGGGVMLPVTETVIFNPSASFTYERVEIDGYTEEDGIASLAFGDTDYEVGRISVGGTLIFSNDDPTGFRGTLRASLEHDVFDDTIDVQMGPDQANLATVSAPRPDRTYGFLQAQLVKPVFGDGAVTLATSAVIGYEGLTGLTGSLSFRKGF